MSIKIKFDSNHNAEIPTIILANRNGKKIGKLPCVNVQIEDHLNSASMVKFDVYKADIVDSNKLSGKIAITAFDVFASITSEEKTRLGQIEESKYSELYNYFLKPENISELGIKFKKDNVNNIVSDGIVGVISSDQLYINDSSGDHIVEINRNGYVYLYNSNHTAVYGYFNNRVLF